MGARSDLLGAVRARTLLSGLGWGGADCGDRRRLRPPDPALGHALAGNHRSRRAQLLVHGTGAMDRAVRGLGPRLVHGHLYTHSYAPTRVTVRDRRASHCESAPLAANAPSAAAMMQTLAARGLCHKE